MVRWVVRSILNGMDTLSYFSFQPVLHNWVNKDRGMCYPVCGMVHIKEPLLLIRKSSPLLPHRHILLAARVLLYASSHRQNNTYHSLCYTSRGALAGTRSSSMGRMHIKFDNLNDVRHVYYGGVRCSSVVEHLLMV